MGSGLGLGGWRWPDHGGHELDDAKDKDGHEHSNQRSRRHTRLLRNRLNAHEDGEAEATNECQDIAEGRVGREEVSNGRETVPLGLLHVLFQVATVVGDVTNLTLSDTKGLEQ